MIMFVGWNFCPFRAYVADIVTALIKILMHIQCNMLFKIFGKVQNYAKTIVRPNGPNQSWMAGHHHYDPTETRQVWKREFTIRNANMIRIVSCDDKEWEVHKINREIVSQ